MISRLSSTARLLTTTLNTTKLSTLTRQFSALPNSSSTSSSSESAGATRKAHKIKAESKPLKFDIFTPTEEHGGLRKMLRTFTEAEIEPQAMSHNSAEKFNLPLFRSLGPLGLLGITVPIEYGGSGMDATAAVIAFEEVCASDPAFGLSLLAHSMLFTNNLAINGNEHQKTKYLPGACDGTLVGGMCMSEPGAGTDVLGMITTAKLTEDGESYVLNGTKMWITNGTLDGQTTGDVYLVYAKTGPKKMDVTMFIVEKDTPGFVLGSVVKDKCGMRASLTAELVFDNVVVSKENIVGSVDGAGICMMRNLELERVALAAMSLGIARRCIESMNSYAADRKAFGLSLNTYGQIQKMIAESYASYMAGRSYVYNTAYNLDLQSTGNILDSDGTKLFCGFMAKQIADNAIQVLGGNGYTGCYRVEQLWRDSKLLEIGGGTNEAHHKNITKAFKKVKTLP